MTTSQIITGAIIAISVGITLGLVIGHHITKKIK
jgi:ABC-type nitrate/sulfonate/bicarbonate transport system permease component